MTTAKPDPAILALHEQMFETQLSLQTRLLDYIEQVDEFHVLEEAWEEFNQYEAPEMDPEDPEPLLHFFPWALFYWRRDVPENALAEAREQLFDQEINAVDDEVVMDVLTDALKEGEQLDLDELRAAESADDLLDDEREDGPYVALPPIAIMFMNSVDGADGEDSPATSQTLTVAERSFIEAASQAPYSFFKVNAVGPGEFVVLEDLIVPVERRVYAPTLVDMLDEDDVLYGQVVTLNEASVLCGVAPAVLPDLVLESLEEARARIETMLPEMDQDWRYELEFELRGLYQQMVMSLQGDIDEDDVPDTRH